MQEMFMTRKPSEKGQQQPGAGAVDAETLYRQYLSLRAERDKPRNGTDHPVTEVKKAKSGDILS